MKCNEFREKVADLFDKTIDMQTQAELDEHMKSCPECKSYYDELRETFNMLQPISSEKIKGEKEKKAVADSSSQSEGAGGTIFILPKRLPPSSSPPCSSRAWPSPPFVSSHLKKRKKFQYPRNRNIRCSWLSSCPTMQASGTRSIWVMPSGCGGDEAHGCKMAMTPLSKSTPSARRAMHIK